MLIARRLPLFRVPGNHDLTWVTMTDRGPIIANLLLDGIRDDNPRDDHTALPEQDTLHQQGLHHQAE